MRLVKAHPFYSFDLDDLLIDFRKGVLAQLV